MQYANFVDLEAGSPDRMGLMEKLFDFISNREQYENEALVLKQIARQEYNLNLIVEKIVDVYQQIIQARGPNPGRE